MSLRLAAAAVAVAFVSSGVLAAVGEPGLKEVRAGAVSAVNAAPSLAGGALPTARRTGLEPVAAAGAPTQVAGGRPVAVDSRVPAAGRAAQGAGMIAAVATAPSLTRPAGGRSVEPESVAGPGVGFVAEIDTASLVLAGVGVVGLLAVRRRAKG